MEKYHLSHIAKAVRTLTIKTPKLILPIYLLSMLSVQAETYNFSFNQESLPTFGSTQLNGSGNYELFNFSESFQFGGFKNPKVNLGFKKVNLGTYGFEASGYVNGLSSLAYDYDFGEHTYDLNIPMSIDLNVSSIDANNRIIITSAYSLSSQSAITSNVDTRNAFFNIDPTFNLSAGINAKGCVKSCTNLINQNVNINAFQEDLIDINASGLSVFFDKNSLDAEVGKELSEAVGLFGVPTDEDNHELVGKFARSYGLLGLDIHTPGMEFEQRSTGITINDNNSFDLTSTGEDEFFDLDIDMVDFAASAALNGLGKTLTKLIDTELSTTIGGVKLEADWELVDAEVSTAAALKQNFGFNGTPEINLALSDGQTFKLNAGESIVVQLDEGIESVDVTPTFGLVGDFTSDLALKFSADGKVNALGYDFDLPLSQIGVGYGFNLGKFGVGNINKFHEPASVELAASTEIELYSVNRGLSEFGLVEGQTISSVFLDSDQTGTHGDDFIVGTAGNNVIQGLAGNDVMVGGLGNDIIDGGLGIDTADYRSYSDADGDHLQTGSGITVNLATNSAMSFRGNKTDTDTLVSIENVSGSKLNDTINGDRNNNVLKGRAGDDTLRGYAGNDKIYGGAGSDLIRGGNGDDILDGGFGADRVFADNGDDLIVVSAETFNAGFFSVFSSDEVHGGEGNDTIQFIGKQAFEGYPFLFISKFFYTAGIYADLEEGQAKLFVGRNGNQGVLNKFPLAALDEQNRFKHGQTSITGVENIIGTQFDDVLKGNDDNNVLDGREGHDRLFGGGGNDTLIYSLGDIRHNQGEDYYYGGNGVDVLDASNFFKGVTIDQNSERVDVENLIGSRFDDSLSGDNKDNVIDGHLGSNYINAKGGDDTIIIRNTGHATTNTVIGGTGNDTITLSDEVQQVTVIASYNKGNLELGLSSNHKIILDGQYSTSTHASESLSIASNTPLINVSGSFENLVNTGDFNRYKVESDFSSSENFSVVTHLEVSKGAILTNQNTLINDSILSSKGTLINDVKLVNKGTLIISDLFINNGFFENTNTGRTHYATSSVLEGNILNNGLIDVVDGETLNITGNYFGSGFLVGDISFNNVSMNIGNSPGSTNIFGSASFGDVDFNLEIGEDIYGNIEYDDFNVFGDFILGDNFNVTLSLIGEVIFEDLIDIDFNFLNVTGSIFDSAGGKLSIDDLVNYKVEVMDGFFANWFFDESNGFSLSFNGSDLFIANGGVLPSDPSEVSAPKTLSLLLASMLVMLWRRKTKALN